MPNNVFNKPTTTQQLLCQFHSSSNQNEKKLLAYIGDRIISLFAKNMEVVNVNKSDIREIIIVAEMTLTFKKRILEIFLRSLAENHLVHDELWQGLNELVTKFMVSSDFSAFISTKMLAILQALVIKNKNALFYFPYAILANLKYCNFLIRFLNKQQFGLHVTGKFEDTPHVQELLLLTKDSDPEISYQASLALQGLINLLYLNSSAKSDAFSHTDNDELSENTKNILAKKVMYGAIDGESLKDVFPTLNLEKNKKIKASFRKKTDGLKFHYESSQFVYHFLPHIIDNIINNIDTENKLVTAVHSCVEEQLFLVDTAEDYLIQTSNNAYLNLLTVIVQSQTFFMATRLRALMILLNPSYQEKTSDSHTQLRHFFTLALDGNYEEKCFALVYCCINEHAISNQLENYLVYLNSKKHHQLVNDVLIFLAKYPSDIIKNQARELEHLMLHKSSTMSLRNLAEYYYPKGLPQECNNRLLKRVLRESDVLREINNFETLLEKMETPLQYEPNCNFFAPSGTMKKTLSHDEEKTVLEM